MAEKRSEAHQASVPSFPCATPDDNVSDNSSDVFSIHPIQVNGADEQGNALKPTMSYASGAEGYTDIIRPIRTGATLNTVNTDPAFEVDWEETDQGNPREWPLWYKSLIIFAMSFGTTTVVMYSTSYTSAIPGIEASFGTSETISLLGVTTYLLGMASGSVILAPLSEMYGRRPIYIIAMAIFTILVLPCALATSIEAILITRFFGALAASAMISNAPGTVNDIVVEEYRALAFSIWSMGPMNGPVFGPIVGGFAFQYLGWRWTNWIVLILGGVSLILIVLVRETYAPAILRERAARRRKETGDGRWQSPYDEKQDFLPLLKLNLSRPFVMMFTEPICYPIVFTDIRGWSYGISGLAYCGIGVGTLVTIASEPLLRKMINAHKKDPETGQVPPEAMVSVICIAAILLAVGQIWFAWTCTPDVHWIVPILAGIPFGAGNSGVFIYSNNYLVHSYSIYAASALAGNALFRSVMGATIPLAGPAMYAALGPNWSGMLCGLLEVACIPIPFVFYFYGKRIRMKSALIRKMQEDKARADDKKAKAIGRAEKQAIKRGDAEAAIGSSAKTGAAVTEERDIEKMADHEI